MLPVQSLQQMADNYLGRGAAVVTVAESGPSHTDFDSRLFAPRIEIRVRALEDEERQLGHLAHEILHALAQFEAQRRGLVSPAEIVRRIRSQHEMTAYNAAEDYRLESFGLSRFPKLHDLVRKAHDKDQAGLARHARAYLPSEWRALAADTRLCILAVCLFLNVIPEHRKLLCLRLMRSSEWTKFKIALPSMRLRLGESASPIDAYNVALEIVKHFRDMENVQWEPLSP